MDKKKTREEWALEAARFFYATLLIAALFWLLKWVADAISWGILGCNRNVCGVDALVDGVIYSFRQIAIICALWFTASLVKFWTYRRFNMLGWNEGEELKGQMIHTVTGTVLCLIALGVTAWIVA